MQLNRLVRSLRRHLVTGLLLGAVLGLATAVTSFATAKQSYTATNTMLFQVAGQDMIADPNASTLYSTQLASSYVALLRTPVVVEPVAKQADVDPAQLGAGLTVVPPRQNLTATISWDDTDEHKAREIVTAAGQQLAKVTEDYTDKVSNQPRITLAQQSVSVLPQPGTGRSLFGSLFKGAAVGMAALLGWLVLRALTDNRVRDARDVAEVTDSSVLATVHGDDDLLALARGINYLDAGQPPVVTFTAAGNEPGTGRLALGVARGHHTLGSGRTLLVDADLRAGEASHEAGAANRPGLSELLSGQVSLDEALTSVDGLDLLPSGALPPNPAELLASPRLTETLAELARRGHTVVVATSPMPGHSDASLVANATGGAVIVSTRRTTRAQISESLDALETVAAKPLGIVLQH